MNKKGFTLIELLAVILILGVIALIAIPQVNNVINQSRKGALEVTVKNYIKAVNEKVITSKLDEDKDNDINDGYIDTSSLNIEMSGKKPTSGTVFILNENVVEANLVIDDKSISYDKDGNSKIYDRYVYYAGQTSGITKEEDGSKTRPTDFNVYLKYPVVSGKLQTPDACFYDGVIERCLMVGDDELNYKKMYDCFGVPMEELFANSGVQIKSKNNIDNKCTYYFNNDTRCSNYKKKIFAAIKKDGTVAVMDPVLQMQWGVRANGTTYFIKP